MVVHLSPRPWALLPLCAFVPLCHLASARFNSQFLIGAIGALYPCPIELNPTV